MNQDDFMSMLMHLIENKNTVTSPMHVFPTLVVKFGEAKADAFVNTTLAEAIQHVTIKDILQVMASEQ